MDKIFLYEKEVSLILENNDGKLPKEMYDRTIQKLDAISSRMNKITLCLILCVCVYPLASSKGLVSVSIGPFGLNNFDLISKSIPVVFAYLCFEYALSASHQRQLSEVSKQFIISLYNDYPREEVKAKGNYVSFLANLLLPFTLQMQVSRLANLKASIGTGIFLLFLWLPLTLIYFSPVFIEVYFLVDLWQKTGGDFWTIASIVVSIWFFLLIIIYYICHAQHDAVARKETNN